MGRCSAQAPLTVRCASGTWRLAELSAASSGATALCSACPARLTCCWPAPSTRRSASMIPCRRPAHSPSPSRRRLVHPPCCDREHRLLAAAEPLVKSLNLHGSAVLCLTADDKYILSASKDGSLALFDWQAGKLLQKIKVCSGCS